MTSKNNHPKPPSSQNKERPAYHRKELYWMVGGTMVVIVLLYFFFRHQSPSTLAPVTEVAASNVSPDPLIGSWIRPDGGYQLEIRSARKDGTLEAVYLNPQPINISRAEWHQAGGSLKLLLELNDVNYPGSTYTLDYLPDQDRLVGNYFQAVYQENYYVEFVRNK